MKFAESGRPSSDRSMAIGCIADVFQELGSQCSPYVITTFPVILNCLSDTTAEVRRNAAYCCGVVCQMATSAAAPFFEKAVTALLPLIDTDVKDNLELIAARDNAISSIAKITTVATNSVPLDKMVEIILRGCPLTGDYGECKSVYGCIMGLCQTVPQVMTKHLGTILNIFSQVIGVEQVPKEVQTSIVQFCKSTLQTFGAQLQPVIEKIPQPRRDNFLRVLQS